MRKFLGRDELYPEETYHLNKLSQRVCLNIQYDAVHNELYEIERENGLITSTSLIGKDIKYKRTANMLFYVREELLASK